MSCSRSFAPEAAAVALVLALAASVGCDNRNRPEEDDVVGGLVAQTQEKLRVGELAEAAKLVERLEGFAADEVDVRLLSAQIAWHLKDYDKSARLFSSVSEEMALAPSVRAQALAGLGVVEMTRNEPELARFAFLLALRLDRRNAAAWYHLGLLYRDSFGYLEAAREQFSIYVRLEAEASPRVQKTQRAIIPGIKDLIARALSERPGAATRNSAASATSLAKAEVAWKKGAFKTARSAYEAALAADALSYPAALGLAKAILKVDNTRAGRERALEKYRLACVLRPEAVSTYLAAGALAEKLGRWVQAREIYSRAFAANPASLDAVDGLIRSFRKLSVEPKVQKAARLYRETLAAARKKR